jgi:hypothetical protein
MFDRDEHPNFARAIDLADRHGIKLAMSNPCLELWFILHFEDQTAYSLNQLGYAPLPPALIRGGLLQAAHIPGHGPIPSPAQCH